LEETDNYFGYSKVLENQVWSSINIISDLTWNEARLICTRSNMSTGRNISTSVDVLDRVELR